jgi:riboflavin kinase/FMN adenylyltransferase
VAAKKSVLPILKPANYRRAFMRHYRSLDDVQLGPSCLTIGSFDGVHIGHQAIIHALTGRAHALGESAVVLTFYPHPAVVLGKRQAPLYLTSPEERAHIFGSLSVDAVITYPFTPETANLSYEGFLTLVKNHVDFKHLIVGYDFALGKNRSGNVEALQTLGAQLKYTLEVLPPVNGGEGPVSSSQVRMALLKGDVQEVRRLLGRPFRINGEVIHGDGRGRTIGIPTANLNIWEEQALPAPGVYACLAEAHGRCWKAVTNIGYRPTFMDTPKALQVETHLLDFDANLYGQVIALSFVDRLRAEIKFSGVNQLLEQINQDIKTARNLLTV